MLKNISVYSEFRHNHQMGRLIFDQRSRLNAWGWTVTVKSWPLDHRWTHKMKPRDYMKLIRRVTPSVRSEISPRVHRSPPNAFNLSHYNSLDKRLRLNILKYESSSNHNVQRTPSLKWKSTAQFLRAIRRSTGCHVTPRSWSLIAIDRTLQIAPRRLRANIKLKTRF